MNPVPVMLRCRIADHALRVYPKGLTVTNLMYQVSPAGWRSPELAELLRSMVRDGYLATRLDPPPPHRRYAREPLRVYVASPALRGERRCGRG